MVVRSVGDRAVSSELEKVFGIQRSGEVIALGEVATKDPSVVALLAGLDAFNDDFESEVVAQVDDGRDDRSVVLVAAEALGEASVDLDDVEGVALEVGQAGASCPEV